MYKNRHFSVTDSSLINSFCYDARTQILEVTFIKQKGEPNTQSCYAYENISQELFFKFISAESMGNFFLTHIKKENINPTLCSFVFSSGKKCILEDKHFASHKTNEL